MRKYVFFATRNCAYGYVEGQGVTKFSSERFQQMGDPGETWLCNVDGNGQITLIRCVFRLSDRAQPIERLRLPHYH